AVVKFAAAAGHYARAVPRSFFAARNTDAKKADALFRKRGFANLGVSKMGIAAVDDKVARFDVRKKIGDHRINDLARRNEQHYASRPRELCRKLRNVVGLFDRHTRAFFQQKLAFFRVQIITDARKAVLSDVQ